MEMDFHGMKRKRLQALCKKHGIPANLKNKEMADRLFLVFKGKDTEDPVGSGNGGANKDVKVIDLVSPSPALEERSNFSSKKSKISEFEMNLSPEITREDFGICGVEEDMKSELNKEQVAPDPVALQEFNNHLVEREVEKLGDQANLLEDACGTGKAADETEKQEENANNPEGFHRNGSNLLLVSPEESDNHLVEGDVEKFSDQTNLVEDVCGTGMTRAETEKQDGNANSPEGSNRNYLNLSLASREKFDVPLVEGEAKKSDDYVCVPDAVHNVGNESSEVGTMHLDTIAMDIDGKTNVTVEHFSDEVLSSCEVNCEDLNIHQMVVSGTGTRNADWYEAMFVSSPKMSLSPASKSISFSPKLLNNSVTEVSLKPDIDICDVKENIQIDIDNQEVVHAAPYIMEMNDEDLVQVPSEEFGNHLLEGEVEKLSDKNNLLEDVCENGKGRDESVERGDHNSPQGSNIKDENVLHVSQEELGYPLVEEIQKSNDNNDTTAADKKTNLASGHFADNVPNVPSSFEYSNSTPDQFLRSYSENEAKSIDLNNQARILNQLSAHADICEEELKSPEKTGSVADPGECFEFKGFQAETYFDSSALGDVGTCNMNENMQKDKMEKVEYSQGALQTKEDVNLLDRSMECNMNIHLEQGEVTGLFNNSDVHDDVDENGREDDANTPQGSNKTDLNLLLVSHEEFGNTSVKGVKKLDDYVYAHNGVYNVSNGRSKGDTGCLDSSIGPINNDGKTNASVEHFIDEFHSSTFKNSDGTPVHFMPNDVLREVKSDLNINEMVASGIVIENEDTSEANIVSSRKIGLSLTSERKIGFSPMQLSNSETQVLQSETIFSSETKKVDIGICDVEENMQIDVNKEQVDDNQHNIHAASSVMVLNDEDLVQVSSVEIGDNLLEGEVEKSGLIADSEKCIGILPNNLEPSATKGFQAETYFDPSTLGDAVAACNMEESLQSDQMEKEYSEEVFNMANELVLLQRSMEESNPVEEVARLFDNSDYHEDAGVTGTEDDKNQHYTYGNMNSFENNFLNGFQPIDEKLGECVPTIMPQPGKMKSCPMNMQNSTSGTVSGDEGAIQEKLETPPNSAPVEYIPTMSQTGEMKSFSNDLQRHSELGTEEVDTIQEKLETPPKSTPIAGSEDGNIFYPKLLELSMKKEMKIVKSLPVKHARDALGNSDMKENIKIAKKDQVGSRSIISKSAFPKRQPLQDLQQN
ncbi:hypothetical protein Fmac_016148 [Flemingia macrophylla]|uniref:SAP domain-containing protein n=1 Tax=Flemingia macrophylla TaxID=520843 RepID=A0ABD1MGJ7_9FABA